jgi:hypothetical protein
MEWTVMLRVKITLIVLGFVMMMPSFAQSPINKGVGIHKQQIRQRINKIFYWQISELLGLNHDREKRLVTVLSQYDDAKENILDERNGILNKMKVHQGKDKAKINKLLAAYRKNLNNEKKIESDKYVSLEKLFTKDQFAKFLVAERDIKNKLTKLLMSKMQGLKNQ